MRKANTPLYAELPADWGVERQRQSLAGFVHDLAGGAEVQATWTSWYNFTPSKPDDVSGVPDPPRTTLLHGDLTGTPAWGSFFDGLVGDRNLSKLPGPLSRPFVVGNWSFTMDFDSWQVESGPLSLNVEVSDAFGGSLALPVHAGYAAVPVAFADQLRRAGLPSPDTSHVNVSGCPEQFSD